ncbi:MULTISPECIES: ATP phosphoribosyltransferase regulatory subunit [unclassified Leptolyngbya]|uniref:ATP phosphoribosyltransferase regulatory subunit n=1 Tax=unclassified Leptolyngbya TaxID=2650499 RepID=UPI001686AC26|nr:MULTISPECIES: ATP phosphoribosyltransferase regulatory subunit [unclassified Leptolyngbya]MBD1913432.1 ATP phosphoribosyltransferase regulatory subunit [Leptolyngbya sp. FACHB-8]MBD2155827.1 ATP phosphoribosyltransferase regulatory subunit [Leptolyngbya sp. FACHB-16]
MVYQPPTGARDLFPVDVAQKRWIEDRLQQVFHRWGYHRIITSTLERMDTLMAGGAIERSTVIQLQDRDEELGMRPELTASIARAAATRMAGAAEPLRFYYNANVFRRSLQDDFNRQQEYYQAGVELLGAGSVAADAEVLWLLSDCVQNLNLESCHLVLGEAGLTRSLFSAFPEAVRKDVREAIATLDRIGLEALPLSPELRDRALLLLDLRGRPQDVLQRVSSLPLDESQQEMVLRLKALVELLEDQDAGTVLPSLILDLSLIQTFDYYTGIVFEVVSSPESGRRILAQGGRYDQLLGLYHPQGQSSPGIGFVFNIEDLHQVLLPSGQLPLQTAEVDWLVVPQTPEAMGAAFAHAKHLRQSDSVCVEMELGLGSSADEVRNYGRDRRIRQIAWVKADGSVDVETLRS